MTDKTQPYNWANDPAAFPPPPSIGDHTNGGRFDFEPPAPPRPKRKWLHWIAYPLVLFMGVGIGSAGNSTPETIKAVAPTVTETVAATPGAAVTVTEKVEVPGPVKTVTVTPKPLATIPGDGIYEVGVDVKAGRYISPVPDSGNCYFARLKDDTGSLNSIIDNNNSAGQTVVTIKKTDKFFETSGCNDWQLRK